MIAAALASRYRSLFVIGRGGMGSVEAALEVEDGTDAKYQRVVALKRLLPDAARDKRRAEMFLREAKLAAMLDHPNVVRAFDWGEIEGELYLAMEYVEGQPLARVLRVLAEAGEKLSPSLVAYVLAEVCEGLHAAHELKDASGQPLQLVHRDVSPQNVMLAYDGHVRLLDFGVAKIETENVTKTGEVKGKTAYMSPEQAMGDPIDRRSDLFGVGAILYECIALRRMWGDGTDMETIRKLALEEPPSLGDAAPAEMRALYEKLVARDAKDRPATAREVADALSAFVPEGKDAARKALTRLLDDHFATQARELRDKLAASLDEIAPSQASELRESVSPSVPPPVAAAPRAKSSWMPLMVAVAAVGVAGIAFAARRKEPAPKEPPPPVVTIQHDETAPSPRPPPQPQPPPRPKETAAPAASVSAPPPVVTAKPTATITVKKPVPTTPSAKPSASASERPVDVIKDPL